MPVDDPGIFQRQDAGVVQSGHDSNFTLHLVERLRVGRVPDVGNLDRNLSVFDQVVGCKNGRESALAKASQEPVFVEPGADAQPRTWVAFTAEDLQGGWHWHLVCRGTKSLVSRDRGASTLNVAALAIGGPRERLNVCQLTNSWLDRHTLAGKHSFSATASEAPRRGQRAKWNRPHS